MWTALESAVWRVAVLAGGDSAERSVSLRSGTGVADALSAAGHRVTSIDLSERPLAHVDWSLFDAAFIALHGGAGEDGRVQQQLEDLGVAYTGSSPAACRLAMSKSAAKERFRQCGVPTPPFLLFNASDAIDVVARRATRLGYPLVIKPDGQGSSLGVAIADGQDDLATEIAAAAEFDRSLLAEAFVRGREFTVAVLSDRPLPLLEIVSPQRIFSYEFKYHSSQTQYSFDFELGAQSRGALVQAAVGATQAIGTSGLARVDLMLDDGGQVWVLEVNTSPGMTARSLAPQAAARAGLDMPALCNLLVRKCLAGTGVA